MKQEIKQMSQIQHVLHRPSVYVGSVVSEKQEEFILNDNKFEPGEREYVPALIKIFNELIDNSIDEFVRTNGKYATKINVKIADDWFECSDNGRGIPNTKMKTLSGDELYQAEVAFTQMLSGANYENDGEATLGTNGIGSKASSIFSKKSVIKNADGETLLTISTKNNLDEVITKIATTSSSGVHSKIWPDLEYFKIDKINDIHVNIIKERLLHLSIAYPGITFRFNGKSLKLNTKKYFEMFDILEIADFGHFSVGVGSTHSDQFEHFSLVNGLVTKSGGAHINYITGDIVHPIRDKLVKKFKTIKPADIRSKLRIVVVFRDFMNARYTSQTKEELKNSSAEIKSYVGDFDLYNKGVHKFVSKILRNDDIMLPMTELFTLREQAKENAALKKLKKTKKRIKSEKYLPATKNKKVLLLCEGASAVGGLMPGLGREDYGYFELRGVPLNAYEVTTKRMMENKELSELYTIIQNEEYDYIGFATDADSDGQHIKGLLFGFFLKYMPELVEEGRICELQTPVQAVIKNGKLQRWIYDLTGSLDLKPGETGKYYKGLGSFKPQDLEHVVKTDGINKMLNTLVMDNHEIVDDWLSNQKADKRKEYLTANTFDITAV